MDVLAQVETLAPKGDLPLSLKFSNYQRQQMLIGLRLQRDHKVDAASLMKDADPSDCLNKRAFMSPKGNIRCGVEIMA